jgi:hypothetical protein
VDKHWSGSGSLLLNKKFLGEFMHSGCLGEGLDLASALWSVKSHLAPLTCKEKCSCIYYQNFSETPSLINLHFYHIHLLCFF